MNKRKLNYTKDDANKYERDWVTNLSLKKLKNNLELNPISSSQHAEDKIGNLEVGKILSMYTTFHWIAPNAIHLLVIGS